ncbi:hypothetical protein EQW79_018115 [Cellulosimicrobium terreum]|uniref:Uncharacterized protein n=2 Tax=Cellulosimicrobium funkei TaxID=264251 RepID=A0A4Y8QXM7_9MICO|nr:hypothetical protein [Cellulosimicrobium funkei]TFF04462.1 hypothetical protein E1O70_18675 [Cellulosimicrobium funkei]TGA67873.1 hypothetical protein EQW79_018115 [Cellulosimicrobium terreum]
MPIRVMAVVLLGAFSATLLAITAGEGMRSGNWVFFRAAVFGLAGALVVLAALLAWNELRARRHERVRTELTEKFAQMFTERIPHTVPAVINLARELGHTDDRTTEGAPVLELHGGGRLTLHSGRAARAWAGTYDLRTVRKVRNHIDHDPVIIDGVALGDIETAIVFYRDVEYASEPLFALDVMWLALPEVRDYLRANVPAGIRNDFTSEWLPRPRPAYLSTSDDRRHRRWRHALVSTYGSIEWDDSDREKVTITAPTRGVFVPTPERLAETRRQVKEATEASWTP